MSNIFISIAMALSGAGLFFFNLSPFATVGYQAYLAPQKIPATEVTQPLDRGIDQCKECRFVLYGTVWEVLFKMPEGWEVEGSEPLAGHNIRHVISANGAQWYFLDKTSGDGELGNMNLTGKSNESISFVFYRTLPEILVYESVKDFNSGGFKGKIYKVSQDQGGGETLFFELPDKKYGIAVAGKGVDFDEFIKGIKLAK